MKSALLNQPSQNSRRAGFTLLEVIIALSILGALISTAVAVQDAVVSTGIRLSSGDREWTAERFLRAQVETLDAKTAEALDVGYFDNREIIFVTPRSGLYGEDGPPALVRYAFNSATRSLVYDETILPPLWDGAGSPSQFIADWRTGRSLPGSWSVTAFQGVERGTFFYWQADNQTWTEVWTKDKGTPTAIKVSLWTLTGRTDIIMETPGSSYFSSFGS
jgi:prepilin-type N-terminal cleavage/methylation domain-containing protein